MTNEEFWQLPDSTARCEAWKNISESERSAIRKLDSLSPQLVGLEGWRVEVETTYGEKRRFIVGRSTGWVPCHIELYNRRSHDGPSAEKSYKSVKPLYRANKGESR